MPLDRSGQGAEGLKEEPAVLKPVPLRAEPEGDLTHPGTSGRQKPGSSRNAPAPELKPLAPSPENAARLPQGKTALGAARDGSGDREKEMDRELLEIYREFYQ